MDPANTPRLRDLLVEQLVGALAAVDPPREADAPMLATRAGFLVDAFLESLAASDPERFARYVAKLAISRLGDGRFLREMIRSFDVMEAAAWDHLAGEEEPSAALPRLRELCRVMGAARDQLARSYRAHARLAERELDNLARLVHELAPGSSLRLRLTRLARYLTVVCE